MIKSLNLSDICVKDYIYHATIYYDNIIGIMDKGFIPNNNQNVVYFTDSYATCGMYGKYTILLNKKDLVNFNIIAVDDILGETEIDSILENNKVDGIKYKWIDNNYYYRLKNSNKLNSINKLYLKRDNW